MFEKNSRAKNELRDQVDKFVLGRCNKRLDTHGRACRRMERTKVDV